MTRKRYEYALTYTKVANALKLSKELQKDKDLKNIYTDMGINGDKIEVRFTRFINQAERDALEDILGDHVVEGEHPYYKIYDFLSPALIVDKYKAPLDIDFKTMLNQMLAKKTLPKVNGKPTVVEYYETYENGSWINLICRRTFDLTYDAGGFITQKIDLLEWFLTDGSLGEGSKDLGRKFDAIVDMEARIEEGKYRRGSIVNGLQLPILAALLETAPTLEGEDMAMKQGRMILVGRDFLTIHKDGFENFIDHSDKAIITEIAGDSHPEHSWLTNAVPSWGGARVVDYILNELNI